MRKISTEITDIMLLIVKNIVDKVELPLDWNVANVTPIFKIGGRKKQGDLTASNIDGRKTLTSVVKDVIIEHV